MSNAQKKLPVAMIHSVIGVVLMLIISRLPAPAPITATGMEVVGIFLGTLYLWTTVDIIWSSLLCIVLIGMSSYATLAQVFQTAFGNPVVVQMLFLMIFAGALVYERITIYIGRWFLTRKFTEGKPWLFTAVICYGAFFMSIFLGCFCPIFLLWPVFYGIFQQLGYTRDDKYAKLAIILIVLSALCGFPVPPYQSNGLALLTNYRTIAENPTMINDGMYFICTMIIGLVVITVVILFCKFVLRPDVEKLKAIKASDFEQNPLPPLSLRQKLLSVGFIIFVLSMLLPSWFPTLPGMAFLKANSTGLAVLFVAVLCGIQINGEPVIKFGKVLEKNVAWGTYYLCTAAILIGSVLTAENTGITAFLNQVLSPIFSNMSTMTFVIVLLVVMMVLTNLCNSLVIGMIMQPVILTYCTMSGVNAAPIVTLSIFFVLGSAMVTPSASPFAAMMFSNKEWLDAPDIYKYGGIFALLMLAVVLVVGVPLANLMIL